MANPIVTKLREHMSQNLEDFLNDMKRDTRDPPPPPPPPPTSQTKSSHFTTIATIVGIVVVVAFLKYSVFKNTLTDDGIQPTKVIDAVLGMTPTIEKKPTNGCVVAFGPGSENAHVQILGNMYSFTADSPVQVELRWFPAQSNKCN